MMLLSVLSASQSLPPSELLAMGSQREVLQGALVLMPLPAAVLHAPTDDVPLRTHPMIWGSQGFESAHRSVSILTECLHPTIPARTQDQQHQTASLDRPASSRV